MSQSAGLELDRNPDAPLLAADGQRFSRGEIRAISDRLAGDLDARGRHRLMVHSDRSTDLLPALDASSRYGFDLFIAHTTVDADVIDAIVADQGIDAVLRDGHLALVGEAAASGQGGIFMMTSGTTGRPKIVSHSFSSLAARARRAAEGEAGEPARWLLTYQPTGFAGIQVQLTAALTGAMIVAPAQRNPAGFREAALAHEVTHISATPTFWRAFLMTVRAGELSLRQATLGGEAADQSTLDRIHQVLPEARITHTYASTEAGVVYAVHDGLEGFPAAWLDDPARPIQLRIVDDKLQIQSRNAMRGYVGAEDQPLHDDGWLATSDRVERRGDRVIVIGRDDATINVAGSKVYPLEIERVLLGQAGVAEARVYGMANPISGALVAADVVLAEGADQATVRAALAEACRDQLATYKRPRIIKFVDSIATAASGKKG